MAIIRWLLGRLILLLNAIFRPRAMQRSAEAQQELDQRTAHLALYQYEACPFCVKVRRSLRRNGLNIEIRDAKRNDQFKQELQTGGGKLKVPCLRIEDSSGEPSWMYESSDIIAYLEKSYVSS
ncbi:glutathione S-transferase N-terminal domain-containing protein [Amphritea sp. HPY]|uniref:glutathione S-transferase N-terminal domain-containing protein n=1 Tax=Amphritea sp. HPY TaxID=3421652 RepID=UPI003D7D1AC7